MKIRNRLTLQFAGIVAFILLVFCITIYHQASLYTFNEFEGRLKDRAFNTAQLLLNVDEIDDARLKTLRRQFLQNLPQEFVRVYDENDNIVFKDDSLVIPDIERLLSEIKRTNSYGYNIGKRQYLGINYDDNQGKFIIIASAVDIFGQSKLDNLRLALIIGYFTALIIIIISGRFFAKAALNPITAVREQAEKITASNLYLRIPQGRGKDEIEKLAYTFNKMFERLQNSFEMQKSFVSNASHELRTPLTAITGEVEVALMKERTPAEYRKVLESILEETTDMTQLSNGLLQLAQAGSEFNALSFNEILMEEVVMDVYESFSRRNKDAKLIIDINKSETQNHFYVSGSKELLQTALQNVVGNAFKFSQNKPVTLKMYQEDGNVIIEVKDKGVGMSEKDLQHVFEPFYRSDNVRFVPGHGIGLSLTEKIITHHKGNIDILSSPGKGTTIIISLPIVEKEE